MSDYEPVNPMTPQEMIDSLSGYDGVAIEKAFGHPWNYLHDNRELDFAQALIFIDRRRTGGSDKEALEFARSLPFGQLNKYFAEPEDEIDPEDPETESGKDDSQPESEPPS